MLRAALLAVTASLLVSCYDVTYPATYACSAEYPRCPSGKECDEANELCVKEGSLVDQGKDAPTDTGPDTGADAGVDTIADATPDLTPDAAADAAADLTDIGPDVSRDLTPDIAADLAGDAKPDVATDATPDTTGDLGGETSPDLNPPDMTMDLAPDLGAVDGGGAVAKWNVVKAGKYVMGTTSAETCFEPNAYLKYRETQHSVTLTRDFEISSLSVTQAQFKSLRGYSPAHFSGCPQCPVETITWSEAAAYCNALSQKAKLTQCYACTSAFGPKEVKCGNSAFAGQKIYTCPGYRLPTEAEYEYAHRAGTTTPLTNGKLTGCGKDPVADANGWYKYNAKSQTQLVGKKPANKLGLYDMAGNVFSWCQDTWSDDLGSSSKIDPVGTTSTSNTLRAVRGASFASPASYLRAAFRHAATGTDRFKTVGLRCVRTLKP